MTNSEALKSVVAAWESLPEGFHTNDEINDWLQGEMAPAIHDAREVLENWRKVSK